LRKPATSDDIGSRSQARWNAARATLLCIALSTGASELSRAEPACVTEATEAAGAHVVDARTLGRDDGAALHLAGIEPFTLLLGDAGDPEGALARRLAALVSGAPLRVQVTDDAPDRYGRLPALVAAGGALLQEQLAREGLAIAFAAGDPLPCFDRLLAAEAEARRASRGFWARLSLPEALPEALAPRLGQFAIFQGTVVSVGTRPATTYLDFGVRWQTDVTIEIAAKNREAFGGEAALAKLEGARIRARGFLVDKAGPMLAVRSPMQLEILDQAPGHGRITP
jgi:Staphylococcal nuclease homologue